MSEKTTEKQLLNSQTPLVRETGVLEKIGALEKLPLEPPERLFRLVRLNYEMFQKNLVLPLFEKNLLLPHYHQVIHP